MLQINEENTLRSLDGNKELMFQLAQIFAEDAPLLLTKLESSLAAGDAYGARLAAHSLKGLVATFYAQQTVEIAQQIENNCSIGELEIVQSDWLPQLKESLAALIEEIKLRKWLG